MKNLGYFRFPTINKNHLVFVCEDDLWSYNISDKKLSRLTSNYGPVMTPKISPDGKNIAFIGTEDGNTEIYIMPSIGGQAKRLTYDGAYISKIALWKKELIGLAIMIEPVKPIKVISTIITISPNPGICISMPNLSNRPGIISSIFLNTQYTT